MTESEQEQYESVTGLLQLVVRIARVKSQAVASKLQQMKKQATLAAAVLANEVYLNKTACRGLVSDGDHQLATGRCRDWQRLRRVARR